MLRCYLGSRKCWLYDFFITYCHWCILSNRNFVGHDSITKTIQLKQWFYLRKNKRHFENVKICQPLLTQNCLEIKWFRAKGSSKICWTWDIYDRISYYMSGTRGDAKCVWQKTITNKLTEKVMLSVFHI